jgi:hypothetical protein
LSDEHVNNIIYQALTIPTFRLVVFGSPETNKEIQRLRDLHDPRVWIIWGETPDSRPAQYFDSVVENLLPETPADKVNEAVERVITNLLRPGSGSLGAADD